jgi:hypothetical protein
MKNIFILLNVILVIFCGLRILTLKTDLERIPPAREFLSQLDIKEILRPVVIKEFESRKIFDTKVPDTIAEDGAKTDKMNQIEDGDVLLRLKGIIKTRNLSFVVLAAVTRDKESETAKLLKGENFRGYIVEKIFEDYVELSKTGMPGVCLRIFKPDQI